MWKRKLCLGTSKGFDLTTEEQIRLFAETGFEGFFTASTENLKECRKVGDSLGMLYQSIHAPFGNAAKMWRDDCDIAVKELFETLEKCHEVEVDLLVCHTWISFDYDDKPNESGIEAWDKVIRRAKELGVRIALENTEGEEFLASAKMFYIATKADTEITVDNPDCFAVQTAAIEGDTVILPPAAVAAIEITLE